MKILRYEKRHNNDLGMDYFHTEAEHNGRFIEVNTDERGHHVRLDRNPLSVQACLDDRDLLKFFYFLFGKKS